MRLLLIMLACALGCQGSTNSILPLAGSAWVQRLPDRSCDHQLTFADDGQYLETMICVLGDYSQAAQVNMGTYHVVDGDTLTTVVDESSCSTNSSGSVGFLLNGDSLHIYTSTGGELMMTRLIFPPGEPTGVPIGCFDDNWLFTAMAVHSI